MKHIRKALRQLQPDRKTFEIIAVTMVMVTAVLFYGFKGDSQTITIGEESPAHGTSTGRETPSASQDLLYVDVDGEVEHPGVYRLVPGARVFEAVDKAGGLKTHADTSQLNLAEKLKDGEKITVPSKAEKREGSTENLSDAGAGAGQVLSGAEKININRATGEELQKIKGIGPATAQKIIDYRNSNGRFHNTEELKNVNGIGDKTYEKMKEYIDV